MIIEDLPPLPYRIFAVDPAVGKSGWCVLDVLSWIPLRISIVTHGQIDGEKLLRTRKEMSEFFDRQFCILDALDYMYEQLIDLYKPNKVVSEGSYGGTILAAFRSLTLAIHTLRRVVHRLMNRDIETLPPTISKKAMTGSGAADKDQMRKAYRNNPHLEGKVDDKDISEHEIDSIAHGYGWIARDVLKTVVQISAKDKKAAKRERLAKQIKK